MKNEKERERKTCHSSLTDVTRRKRKENDCSHHILTSFTHQQKNFDFFFGFLNNQQTEIRCTLRSIFVAYCVLFLFSSQSDLVLEMNKQERKRERKKEILHGRQTKTVLLIADCIRISSSIFNLLIFFFLLCSHEGRSNRSQAAKPCICIYVYTNV